MAFDFSRYLVIGISSRALFDLEAENRIFEEHGLEAYSKYQLEHEDDVLKPGVAFPLVNAILRPNDLVPGKRKAEVVVMSRNNADTSLRIFKSISEHNLDITRAAFTSGASLAPYLQSFDVDLFLSANEADVQTAVNVGVAAARVYDLPEEDVGTTGHQIRIAFDGVLKAFHPHIYFDDQDVHLRTASRHVPAALVPYPSLIQGQSPPCGIDTASVQVEHGEGVTG